MRTRAVRHRGSPRVLQYPWSAHGTLHDHHRVQYDNIIHVHHHVDDAGADDHPNSARHYRCHSDGGELVDEERRGAHADR